MSKTLQTGIVDAPSAVTSRGPSRVVMHMARRPTLVISAAYLVLVAAAALAASSLLGDPNGFDALARLQPPSGAHMVGTDQLGRDVFTRVVYGARASSSVGLATALIAAVLGTVAGILSAAFRPVDAVLMRVVDGVMSFPIIILALALMAILGSSPRTVVISLVVVLTPGMARVVRSQALVVSRLPMIDAASMAGAGRGHVLRRYVLPLCMTPILVQSGVIFTAAVLIESGLSFIGAGLPPTVPSWGAALSESRSYLATAWWMWVGPGAALVLTVLAANTLVDGLRDALDPNGRR